MSVVVLYSWAPVEEADTRSVSAVLFLGIRKEKIKKIPNHQTWEFCWTTLISLTHYGRNMPERSRGDAMF